MRAMEQRRERARIRIPKPDDNMDNSAHYRKIWDQPRDPDPRRVRNYSTLYHQVSRQTAARGGERGAIDITAPGFERLVAEYAGAPGKRLDRLLPRMSKEQVCRVGLGALGIVGPYRRDAAIKKLSFRMPSNGCPPPRAFNFKFPGCLSGLRSEVGKILNELIKDAAQRSRPAAFSADA